MIDLLHFSFMQNALAAGLLAGLACGIIGPLVVVNRVVLVSGGVAHAAYAGVGLGVFLGISPLFGVLGVALAVSLAMSLVLIRAPHRADTAIGAIWALGMACGVILVDITPGYHPEIMSYLFGSILAVPPADIWLMAGLDAVILAVVVRWYQGFAAMSLDAEYARARGVPVTALTVLLMVMVGLTVVMVVRVVGLILVIALLTIAPFLAERTARSFLSMILWSVGLNTAFTLAGLALSTALDLSSGASIILVASAAFLLVTAGTALAGRGGARAGKGGP